MRCKFRRVYQSREDSPELLDIAKVTFDNVPFLVQLLVISPRLQTITLRRNHRSHPTLSCRFSTLVPLIRLVHDQRFPPPNLLGNFRHQLLTLWIVRCRARRQTPYYRQVNIGDNGMDFCRSTATAFSDGLRSFFLGAPVPSG